MVPTGVDRRATTEPTEPPRLSEDVRSAIRYSAFLLANGTFAPDLLAGTDYRWHLTGPGSSLNMTFAVFTKVLQTDQHGRVTNPLE